MVGSNAHERGTTVKPPPTLQSYIEDAHEQFGDLAARYLGLYSATTDAEVQEIGGYAIGDRIFTAQSWAWVNAQSRSGRSPAFYYRFTRVPPTPVGAVFAENPLGVPRSFHGAEIPYVFGTLASRNWPWQPLDRSLSEAMSSYWVNFATHGDPNGADLPRWPRFEPEAPSVMVFGDGMGVGAVPHHDRLAFWDAFFARKPTSLAEHHARRKTTP
jgi:para-nitrobenzyl esterase